MDSGAKLRRVDHEHLISNEREQLMRTPYRALVGSLLYLAIGAHSDISYAVQPGSIVEMFCGHRTPDARNNL